MCALWLGAAPAPALGTTGTPAATVLSPQPQSEAIPAPLQLDMQVRINRAFQVLMKGRQEQMSRLGLDDLKKVAEGSGSMLQLVLGEDVPFLKNQFVTDGNKVLVLPGNEPDAEVPEPEPEPEPEAPALPKEPAPARKADNYSFLDVVAVGRSAEFHCTGILVAPALVLTARHCLPAERVLFGVDVEGPTVQVEVTGADTPDDGAVDAAVLHLSRPVEGVTPRGWRRSVEGAPPRAFVMLMGFGSNEVSGHLGAGRKRRARVPVEGWGCEGSRVRWSGCDPRYEMVILGNRGRDTCDGDSGGPVLEPHLGSWRLLALVSRPIAATRTRCGEGGVYVRVDRLADWLEERLEESKARWENTR